MGREVSPGLISLPYSEGHHFAGVLISSLFLYQLIQVVY